MVQHVYVIGLDERNRAELASVRNAGDYTFHGLVPYDMIVNPASYRMAEIMRTARRELEDGPPVDALIGHWDFPTTSMLPILRREHGLRSPSLESVLLCENKYWARRAMREAVSESTPPFQHVDPFAADPWKDMELEPPFWLKPTVAFSSYLGFHIDSEARFREAIDRIREGIGRFARPFEYIMDHVEDRSALPSIGSGGTCVAESIISGDLCTLEGFVQNGEVVVYGVLDSARGPNQVSFFSYQLPSRLPEAVRERMIRNAEKLVGRLGLDDTPFNIEMFWNREEDRIWILEINPRISKSHCPLFRMTAGSSHHEVAIDVSLGRRPDFPRQDGPFRVAAKFMPRTYQDATVTRVPTDEDVARMKERFPELVFHSHVSEGTRLSDLPSQDSYSFEIADLFLGGEGEEELQNKLHEVMEGLDFRFSEEVSTNYD